VIHLVVINHAHDFSTRLALDFVKPFPNVAQHRLCPTRPPSVTAPARDERALTNHAHVLRKHRAVLPRIPRVLLTQNAHFSEAPRAAQNRIRRARTSTRARQRARVRVVRIWVEKLIALSCTHVTER